MRTVIFSPQATERLGALGPTKEEFKAVRTQLQVLAANPEKGYQFLFQRPSEHLYLFEVGRFGLIYRTTKDRLEVVGVITI